MMLLCYTLFDYDDIILEPENQCSTDNAWGNAPAYVGFCITGVLIPFSFHTFCGGLEAFGGWLVYLIVKSMLGFYHTKHVDVPMSNVKHSYH